MALLQLHQGMVVVMNVTNNTALANHTIYEPYAKWAMTDVNKSLVGTMCCLSILGSLIIIASFASWKDIRTTSRMILLFLSISDLMIATSNLVGVLIPMHDNVYHPKNSYCVAQSFITTSSSIMSFLWTLTLAIYLYLAIVRNKQNLGKKLMPFFHITNWLLGPIINAIALHDGMLGYAAIPITGGWCWIYHDPSEDTRTHYRISPKEMMWIIFDGKGIEIIVYTTICVIYCIIKCKLHKELKQQSSMPMDPEMLKAAKSADQKLIFVPFLLLLGRSFGIIKFFINITSEHKFVLNLSNFQKALLTLEGIGDSSQGFLNCILFCFLNPKVYDHIKDAFQYYVCCRCCCFDYDAVCGKGSLNGDRRPSFSLPEASTSDSKALLNGNRPMKQYGSHWKRP